VSMGGMDFEELVEKHTTFVYNIAYRMMGNPDDAEDVVQDTFIQVYRARDTFRGDAAVTTWLYRIAVNACLMKLRKEKKSRELTQTGYDDLDVVNWAHAPDNERPERAALNTELREALEKGIALLPAELRAAVVLRDIQEMTNTEAADILGISVSSFKARLHRGRILLRKHLDEYVRSGKG